MGMCMHACTQTATEVEICSMRARIPTEGGRQIETDKPQEEQRQHSREGGEGKEGLYVHTHACIHSSVPA